MADQRIDDLPLFPLPVVLLPTELVPLHIFEDRYKAMISECLANDAEFGAIWLADEGLRDVGCSATVAEVLEQMDDGSMNVLVRGTTPFRLVERGEQQAFPTGTVDLLSDKGEGTAASVEEDARTSYADLLEKATEQRPEMAALTQLSAYEMAASVDIGLQAKQGLLELRSEQARLRLLTRLFKDGLERLDLARKIGERAQSNGKIRFERG